MAKASSNQKFINQANYYSFYNQYRKIIENIWRKRDTIRYSRCCCQDLGLGTCWIGAFDEDSVKTILKIPINLKPVAIIPVGYPDETPIAPQRMDLEKLLHWETW